MKSNTIPPGILQFGNYELHLRAGELFNGGIKIRLQQQPFQVLSILLEQAGEVVTREELQKRVWPADTFVDFDHGLNTAIKKLRQALNDDPDSPRYIETLPRRGYRFISSVQGNMSAAAAAASNGVTPSGSPAPAEAKSELVGRVLTMHGEPGANFVLVPVDEDGMKELERLRAASDDLGISLMAAEKRVLVVAAGTDVRVLESRNGGSHHEVRILDGEHIGLTAIAPHGRLKAKP
jgi:DNA-binding winged helix-turn-helix (wHTH) protein